MASRSLDDLIPPARTRAKLFVEKCKDAGIDVLIYCTLRNNDEQNHLYSIGRTFPGKIVTNAKAGQSWHNYGAAFDFVPLVGGKPQWSDKILYAKCGKIAESVGLEWAGKWVSFKETAHCQYTGGVTIAQAQQGVPIV